MRGGGRRGSGWGRPWGHDLPRSAARRCAGSSTATPQAATPGVRVLRLRPGTPCSLSSALRCDGAAAFSSQTSTCDRDDGCIFDSARGLLRHHVASQQLGAAPSGGRRGEMRGRRMCAEAEVWMPHHRRRRARAVRVRSDVERCTARDRARVAVCAWWGHTCSLRAPRRCRGGPDGGERFNPATRMVLCRSPTRTARAGRPFSLGSEMRNMRKRWIAPDGRPVETSLLRGTRLCKDSPRYGDLRSRGQPGHPASSLPRSGPAGTYHRRSDGGSRPERWWLASGLMARHRTAWECCGLCSVGSPLAPLPAPLLCGGDPDVSELCKPSTRMVLFRSATLGRIGLGARRRPFSLCVDSSMTSGDRLCLLLPLRPVRLACPGPPPSHARCACRRAAPREPRCHAALGEMLTPLPPQGVAQGGSHPPPSRPLLRRSVWLLAGARATCRPPSPLACTLHTFARDRLCAMGPVVGILYASPPLHISACLWE